MKYFDAHSHVTFKEYDQDLDEVLKRMEEYEVGTITVGVDLATSQEAVDFAETRDNFYATIGLHPTDTAIEEFLAPSYETLVKHPKVVGIGECGLDYYRLQATGDSVQVEKQRQKKEFIKQLEFAAQYQKPLMLHVRPSKGTMDAYEDVFDILEAGSYNLAPYPGNVHFFVGNVDVARRFYDLNFTTSFTGVLTFAREYDEVVRFAPVDMLLTETDSPGVAPVPYRGQRNEPSYVRHVVEAIARITGLPEDKLAEQIVANARRVFGLEVPGSRG